MQIFLGFLLVLLAALLQGTFVLPMTMVKGWSWEHTWATFSLLGMFFLNWILILLLVPNIFAVYAASPSHDLAVLALFGMGWGLGAVLFGLGMDKLGMALGYPIIMGLIAGLGALIPLLFFSLRISLASEALIFLGTALVIVGIVVCSIGGSRKTVSGDKATATNSSSFKAGLIIAILAGVLSCLPNVGVAYAGKCNRCCGEAGGLGIIVRKHGLGAVVYMRMHCECGLLLVSDGQPKNTGSVFQSSYSAQSGIERADGYDVDWQFLSLWSGSCETWAFGHRGRLAAFHFSFHCGGQHLGIVARGVEGIAARRASITEPGAGHLAGCNRHLGRQQFGLASNQVRTTRASSRVPP